MSGVSILQYHPNLYAKQSRKGCLRTLLGCDSKTEFGIATLENRTVDILYAKEESDFCCRLLCQPIHPFVFTLSQGGAPGGPVVATVERPLATHAHHLKCCCFQRVEVKDGASGQGIGSFTETFYFCVPTYHVKDVQGETSHIVHPPVCCGGILCNPCAEGCCRVPFYIYPKDGYDTNQPPAGKIVKLWGSLATEMMGIHQFDCEFPANATPEQKAVLTGGMLLINEIYFKPDDNKNSN